MFKNFIHYLTFNNNDVFEIFQVDGKVSGEVKKAKDETGKISGPINLATPKIEITSLAIAMVTIETVVTVTIMIVTILESLVKVANFLTVETERNFMIRIILTDKNQLVVSTQVSTIGSSCID